MGRLFGTDGIRGVANHDLTAELAVAVGRASARLLAPGGGRIVVGRDTRLSGPMLEAALVAGLCSGGADVLRAGIAPTPAVSFLTVEEKAAAGAVISASHNPVPDNGIKLFGSSGTKVTTDVEDAIEAVLGDMSGAREMGGETLLEDAVERYVVHVAGTLTAPLRGRKVVLDCAYGAAWQAGPAAFRSAGAEVLALHDEPRGDRINVGCGSTHPRVLADAVVAEGADAGFAFDGDADRVISIDHTGAVVDGDRMIGLLALSLLDGSGLDPSVVVVTVMSNLALTHALEARNIEVVVTDVGDRNVAEAMARRGAAVGGEQSGHVIFSRHAATGDGILTALKVCEAVVATGSPLAELARLFDPYPQHLVNVPAPRRDALAGAHEVWDAVAAAEARLGTEGRVLVRASGTEPFVRVMVEAADGEKAARAADEIAAVVARALA